MTTPSQVQVEQRARSLCLRNFTKACNRYETFLSKVGVSVEENQLYFDDIVSTWNLVQDKQEAYLLTLNDEMYDKELSWIDDAENRFHELRSKKCQLDIFLKDDKIEKEKAEISKKTQEIAEEQELKR